VSSIKRICRIILCGIGLHIWEKVPNASFFATTKYKCRNCGRREVFGNE